VISRIIKLETVDSTSDYFLRLINSGECEDGTLLVAKEQITGKGLSENKWESEPGKNLTLSIYHVPIYLRPSDLFMLNITVSLAVREFVLSLLPSSIVTVKWPNDIYIDNGKVAGILIKNGISGNEFSYCIIGIGININQERFYSGAPNPVSVIHYIQKELDLDEMLDKLMKCIDREFELLQSRQYEKLQEEYLWNLFRLGKYFG
jgi:BirA family transcriptional regulator, biotin operon repressor / biotin---[acetyl-CoA-carboxylase] ligase